MHGHTALALGQREHLKRLCPAAIMWVPCIKLTLCVASGTCLRCRARGTCGLFPHVVVLV